MITRGDLILEIFSKRAQTRQAKLQVELATLRYQLPRLRHMWTHLERQLGARGARPISGYAQRTPPSFWQILVGALCTRDARKKTLRFEGLG